MAKEIVAYYFRSKGECGHLHQLQDVLQLTKFCCFTNTRKKYDHLNDIGYQMGFIFNCLF